MAQPEANGVLFDVDLRTINEHLKNIFESSELEELSAIRNFRITQKEGLREFSREQYYTGLNSTNDQIIGEIEWPRMERIVI